MDLERELEIERRSLRENPRSEMAELAGIYRARGVDAENAQTMAESVMEDLDQALEVHAREELGVDPGDLGNAEAAAASSFAAFAIGALLPLLPWFFTGGTGAVVASIILGVVGAAAVGGALARFTGRSILLSVARQVSIAALAAGATFLIGSAVGTGLT